MNTKHYLLIILLIFLVAGITVSRHEPDIWEKQKLQERIEARERAAEIRDERLAEFKKRQAERKALNKQKQEQEALESQRPVKPVRQTTSALVLRISKLEQEVEELSDVVEFLLERISALENPAQQEIKSQNNPGKTTIDPGKFKILPAGNRVKTE